MLQIGQVPLGREDHGVVLHVRQLHLRLEGIPRGASAGLVLRSRRGLQAAHEIDVVRVDRDRPGRNEVLVEKHRGGQRELSSDRLEVAPRGIRLRLSHHLVERELPRPWEALADHRVPAEPRTRRADRQRRHVPRYDRVVERPALAHPRRGRTPGLTRRLDGLVPTEHGAYKRGPLEHRPAEERVV